MKRRFTIMLLCWVIVLSSTASAMNEKLRSQELRKEPCIAWLVDHEDGTWDPQRGNTSGSYGLPQANPGSKMANAGKDWATNPLTQLRWMRVYVVQRYHGACRAVAHWKSVAKYFSGDWHYGSY